jgi:N-acetylneuraminate synthase/N,N'-diacetyllegionaminate synthase
VDAIRIGPRSVGPDEPVWIIAEAGVNHNGDPAVAKQLVLEAKRAGADCVKFQSFSAARVASATAGKAPYQLRSTGETESQLEMLRRLELDDASFRELRDLCETEGIAFLSTPYDVEDVDFLESLDVPAYKVASALAVEPAFLRRIAATGKPVILSTGLATLAEVEQAVSLVRSSGGGELVVLQCTTDYPAKPAEANLRAMQTMRSELGVLTGYSDHTVTATTAIAAVALGAVVIEKHLTLDRSLPGPDHSTSAAPDEFAALVRAIREAESALGDGRKEPSASELANLESMRRSLVATRIVPAGTVLEASMLTTKRPATGILPRDLDGVVGRTVNVDVDVDQPLEWWMLE